MIRSQRGALLGDTVVGEEFQVSPDDTVAKGRGDCSHGLNACT